MSHAFLVVAISKTECELRHEAKHHSDMIDDESEIFPMQRQVIEDGGLPVGIAVPDDGKLRFIAVKFHVIELDDKRFATAGELKAAIGRHVGTTASLAA